MRVLICCSLLTALCGLAWPGQAGAAEKALWGPLELPDGSSPFPLYRSLGVDTLQLPLSWVDIAPRRPTDPRDPDDEAYRWPADLDRAILEDSTGSGVQIALLVYRSPRWANGNRPPQWVPDADAYADFLTAASRRYPGVRRWMIWGEANDVDTFSPNKNDSPEGPEAYAVILDAAYAALKQRSRRNIVIGGMTYTAGTVKPPAFVRFLRLPGGRRPRLDWWGHNPFPISFPDLRKRAVPGGYRDISDMDVFSREVRRAYARPCRPGGPPRCGRRPRLWLSEFTIQSEQSSSTFDLNVSKTEQARWLRAAYEISDQLRAVAGLGWLQLLNQPEGPRSANWGLMTSAGFPKPAFYAYRDAPSRRHRPSVVAPRRVREGAMTRDVVVVRPAVTGKVVVLLRERSGYLVRRLTREVEAGRPARFGLTSLRRGRYKIVVDAARGERVIRPLRVR